MHLVFYKLLMSNQQLIGDVADNQLRNSSIICINNNALSWVNAQVNSATRLLQCLEEAKIAVSLKQSCVLHLRVCSFCL